MFPRAVQFKPIFRQEAKWLQYHKPFSLRRQNILILMSFCLLTENGVQFVRSKSIFRQEAKWHQYENILPPDGKWRVTLRDIDVI